MAKFRFDWLDYPRFSLDLLVKSVAIRRYLGMDSVITFRSMFSPFLRAAAVMDSAQSRPIQTVRFDMDWCHGNQQNAQCRGGRLLCAWNYRMSLYLRQRPRVLTRNPIFKPPKSLPILVLSTNGAPGVLSVALCCVCIPSSAFSIHRPH